MTVLLRCIMLSVPLLYIFFLTSHFCSSENNIFPGQIIKLHTGHNRLPLSKHEILKRKILHVRGGTQGIRPSADGNFNQPSQNGFQNTMSDNQPSQNGFQNTMSDNQPSQNDFPNSMSDNVELSKPATLERVSVSEGEGEDALEPGHCSTTTAIVNLVADLCPHGMLPLAYGLGAGGGTGGVVGAGLLLSFFAVSAYTLISLGRASQWTKQSSLSGVWAKAVGPDSTWIADASVSALCYGCCVFYSAFIGDIFSALAVAAKLPAYFTQRWVVLLTLSVVPILPLCLLRDLSALQITSVGGVFAIAYTLFFVIYRALDGTYQPGGIFNLAMKESLRPNHKPKLSLLHVGPGTLTLLNMACVAFLCHYNGVGYYVELRRRTVKNFSKVTTTGMAISLVVFLLMMGFGFKTFGYSAQALLLNNYHKSEDSLATAARAATGFSILCGYPLMFAGFKNAFFPALSTFFSKFSDSGRLKSKVLTDVRLQNLIIIGVLSTITAIATQCTEEDVGLVIGLIGSLLGSFCCFIMPAIINIRVSQLQTIPKKLSLGEMFINRLLIVFGLFFAVFGTYTTLKDGSSHHS